MRAECSAARIGLEQRPDTSHIPGMNRNSPPELDMTIEGEFVSPPKPPLSTRINVLGDRRGRDRGWSVARRPGALGGTDYPAGRAGCGRYCVVMFRYRMWRAQRSFGGQRDLWRP